MKKIILIAILLVGVISFGQTKKKKKVKKVELKEVIQQFSEPNKETPSKEFIDVNTVSQTEDDLYIYSSGGVEVNPEFLGGNSKMLFYLNSNFVISTEMKSNSLNGNIIIQFVVEKDGNLSDLKVLRDLGFGTKEEMLRVIKIMPKWLSAEQNGKKVRCLYTLSYSMNATK